jgi:hypothetical protein
MPEYRQDIRSGNIGRMEAGNSHRFLLFYGGTSETETAWHWEKTGDSLIDGSRGGAAKGIVSAGTDGKAESLVLLHLLFVLQILLL